MNYRGPIRDRPTNAEKSMTYVRDSENSMQLAINDHHATGFFGKWSKIVFLEQQLFWEQKERHLNLYTCRMKAGLEIGSLPICFKQCVSSLESSVLDSDEKNCMRDCYFKRLGAKDDFNLLVSQRLASETMKGAKDDLV